MRYASSLPSRVPPSSTSCTWRGRDTGRAGIHGALGPAHRPADSARELAEQHFFWYVPVLPPKPPPTSGGPPAPDRLESVGLREPSRCRARPACTTRRAAGRHRPTIIAQRAAPSPPPCAGSRAARAPHITTVEEVGALGAEPREEGDGCSRCRRTDRGAPSASAASTLATAAMGRSRPRRLRPRRWLGSASRPRLRQSSPTNRTVSVASRGRPIDSVRAGCLVRCGGGRCRSRRSPRAHHHEAAVAYRCP